VRAALYALADRFQLLAPAAFAGTGALRVLGERLAPVLAAREAEPVRAGLAFAAHALAPPTPGGRQVL
jgi:hypothetical protein